MCAFNAACTRIAEHAYAQRCASKFQLQKQLYYEVRQRFGLSAQLAISAIAKVVEACKRDKSQPVAFHPVGAVVYDERIMGFQGVKAVSLTTELLSRVDEAAKTPLLDCQRCTTQRSCLDQSAANALIV